jgi:hypothetical protein
MQKEESVKRRVANEKLNKSFCQIKFNKVIY